MENISIFTIFAQNILDFIINSDNKYMMMKDLEEAGE